MQRGVYAWNFLYEGNLRPVIDHEFRHNIVKVVVDPRGDSRVDPQTTLRMLWRN